MFIISDFTEKYECSGICTFSLYPCSISLFSFIQQAIQAGKTHLLSQRYQIFEEPTSYFPIPTCKHPSPPPPSFISFFVGEILVYWYCTVVEIWSPELLSLCLVIGFCDWIVVIIRNLCWVLMIWSVPPVWQYLCCYTVLCSEGTFDWWLMFKLMPKLKLLLEQVVIQLDMINLASYFEWIIMAAWFHGY